MNDFTVLEQKKEMVSPYVQNYDSDIYNDVLGLPHEKPFQFRLLQLCLFFNIYMYL